MAMTIIRFTYVRLSRLLHGRAWAQGRVQQRLGP